MNNINHNQRKRAIPFNNTYVRLPERFYQRIKPVPVKAPQLIRFNEALADALHIASSIFTDEIGAEIFSGNYIPPDAEPIALAYAGHQFGQFVPQLGDGRAILLGEVLDKSGVRRDIQLKGSGPTAFSRRGDGRAALGPVMREYIVSEAMHALGVPTTRSLTFVTTGEPVYRETILPGAILTRVAASHVRIGTFEYFAARHDHEALKVLADYVIARHYPQLQHATNRYLALLEAVCEAQAELVARWLHIGFIHGVMNTDNMTISGETIDYGPCAFMDIYDPHTVFSSIDYYGRYAYSHQGKIAQWNLASLGQCLLPLIQAKTSQNNDKALALVQEVINNFAQRFDGYWLQGMRHKLGLATAQQDDLLLVNNLLELMHKHQVDYTLGFRLLSTESAFTLNEQPASRAAPATTAPAIIKLFEHDPAFFKWHQTWLKRLQAEQQPFQHAMACMQRCNPAYIARNHRVEQAITAAIERQDFTVMDRLIAVLAKPYDEQSHNIEYMNPPTPEERVYQTFCGT
ncbi:MAG: YdiU family protein [Gammaproteobacteria bacterium]